MYKNKSEAYVIKRLMQSGGLRKWLLPIEDVPITLEWGEGFGSWRYRVPCMSDWVGHRKYPTVLGRLYLVDHQGKKHWVQCERVRAASNGK